MPTMTVEERVKDIKQSFRQLMDGAVAQSMRNKGVDYKRSWGATMPRLREMADELCSSIADDERYALAVALWKENVRECKILATMLMPPDEMLPEVTDIWMEQTPTLEIAEQAAFHLWQHLPYAPQKAYQWIASDKELYQLCGFHVLSRLFMNRQEPNERGINEYLDQTLVALQSDNIIVRKAALNSLNHFAELGIVYGRMADSILRRI